MKALPADVAAVCRRMKTENEVAVAIHEDPDPDALGAAAGMVDLFAQLGVKSALYVEEGETIPLEAFLLAAGSLVRGLPKAGLALYALDSSRFERLALPLEKWDGFIVNIDHHHDNPMYGDLALVHGGASSASELVCDIALGLDLQPSLPAATALYAGISFDSGHFHHQSTGVRTFECAAWLAGLGVDVTAVYGELYERRTSGALRLWARAVSKAVPVAEGRALVATICRDDYIAVGAGEGDTEGVVESLRAVDGVEASAFVHERSSGRRSKASLRSSGIDVSAIAALRGGGGHRLAAGFSSDDSPEEVAAWLSSELARRLSTASCS
jgi:bifunctional oligoribonuclease and PAP phosphatase NrnA